ncbi:MAG: AMP-binding protein, partial [Planctomycetales bacterium]|nr:AMP-binding protein [Planctomycetales bacterium]
MPTVHLDHLPGSFFGPSNLIELLQHRALHQGNDPGFRFLVDGESQAIEWTYAEVDRRARAIAASLQSMDLEGERALLLYPSGLDFVAAFFGCLYAGVTAVPAYPPRRNRNMARIDAIANDAQAKIALTTYEVLQRVQTMIGDTPALQQIRWRATDQWDEDLSDSWRRPDVHGETLAFLQYTSGSTGTPKGVMLSHANLMHNSAMISYAFEHTRSGSGCFWLPLYHDMGLIGGILQPLYMGKSNTLVSPTHFLQKPVRWLKLLSQTGATISGGPNFAYDLCVEKITAEQKTTLDLSRWSLAFNGAEPVRADTIDRFSKAFAECGFRREAFYPCYGLAEATLIVTGGYKQSPPTIRSYEIEGLENHKVIESEPGAEGSRELVGSGGNLLDQHIVIADPETFEPFGDDRVGEIWVSGPSVARGYWQRDELNKEVFQARLSDGRGPFLRTGDLGFLHDGELFVTGRLKDLIILRGVNHYPQDIEQTVQSAHRHVKDAAGAAIVVGAEGNEQLVIVQETVRLRGLNYREIVDAIRKQVATEHELAVSAIVLIKARSIPKTSSGKIQRHACRDGYLAGTLAALATWTAETGKLEVADLKRRRRDLMEPVTWVEEGDLGESEPEAALDQPMAPSAQQQDVLTGEIRSSQPAANLPEGKRAEILEVVFKQVREIGRERVGELNWNTNITELGLDSLERIEIVAALEDTFGGRFPEHILPNMETCGEVVEAIEEHLGGEVKPRPTRPEELLVLEEDYVFTKSADYVRFRRDLENAQRQDIPVPFFKVHEGITNDRTTIGGREYVSFCSYNYLGMSGDPAVVHATKEAVERFGTSVSASRLVSGEKTIHGKLERAIADLIGVEDAIVFVGGHS